MRSLGGARSPFGLRALFISLAVSLAILGALCAAQTAAAQGVRLVATTSDLASLARAVTGDLAQVESIIPPAADPEAFQPRPSDLAKLKGASVVARVGLGYDHWLDKLLQKHGDTAVNRGGPGYVDASVGIPLIEVKGRSLDATGRDGHAHGLANPHYWLDPANAEVMTGGIAEAVIRVAPELTEKIIANRDEFLDRVKARRNEWEQLLAPHRAARLIAYHNTWPYFARRFRLDIVDVIEVKEGVSPSPARLAKLAALIREQKVRVILHEPFEPEEASQLLARRTGAVVLKLAPSVGSMPDATHYLALFDYNVGALARALSAASN
ncbi:MAG: metal ABC transporter substrate-binding protein [Xanthobacteraceae bacterium]|jgi:ABC-type Zn uptake system ZnuABC Zn-binding protein ZnuA